MAYYGGSRIEWDPAKEDANRRKHGVTFGEAARVFDPSARAISVFDEEHSVNELRQITIGRITRGIVVVSWTERDEDSIRIISARFATAAERRMYFAAEAELP